MKTPKLISLIVAFILSSYFTTVTAQDDFSDSSDELIDLSGIVIDSEAKQPVAGANIIVDDSDLGAAADEEGKFNIEGVQAGASLTASAIGYESLNLYADQAELNLNFLHQL